MQTEEPYRMPIRVLPLTEWVCKPLREKYVLGKQIGQGAYGAVYEATEKQTGNKFALKKMENFYEKQDKQGRPFGFPITTLREIKLLQNLFHDNILNIREVVFDRPHRYAAVKHPTVYLCLDLMECDLAHLVKNNEYVFTPSRIQQIARQILIGLDYLHTKNIAHRDLKPSNVLIDLEGGIKVADFGLAKKLSKFSTPLVVTLWYRAPQLLLNLKNYTTNIDIWSVGCMLVQFLTSKPLFYECTNETSLILKIFEIIGTPDSCDWKEGMEQLETQLYQKLKPETTKHNQLIYRIKKLAPEYEDENLLLDLIQKMLRLDPASRYSAAQCLQHGFFKQIYDNEDILPQSIVEGKQKNDELKDPLIKKPKH